MVRSVLVRITIALCLCMAMTAGVFGRAQLEEHRSKDLKVGFAAGPPAHCLAGHRVGKIVLGVNNNGTFGTGFSVTGSDCFTGQYVPSCEYLKGSNTMYLFAGALWIGAVVGRDTLVSVGADGWQMTREMFPDEAPYGYMIYRSIIDSTAPEFAGAVSEQDYIAVYMDTFTEGVEPDYFGRPHKPLPIEVTQNSYAWSFAYAEDFILFDYQIKNIGQNTLENVYMGIYVDGDVYFTGDATGFTDDVCGFLQTVPSSYGECQFLDTVNMAWIADNDGDLSTMTPVPHVTALRLLRTPATEPQVNFNWWASNGNPTLDFGPRMRPTSGDPFRDFGTGGLGTPEGDVNKYYIMRHQEMDYDQIYTASISPTDPIWLYPNQAIAAHLTDGFDTRYLLSFGPFDIDPGQQLPISFAYVAGENLHTDPNNIDNLPDNPDQYYANVDFSDLALNARWASWIYDNPGVDTDEDGYAGKFHVCCDSVSGTCDTIWYAGDGVPDFRGAVPPLAPTFWLEPKVEALRVRWNGLHSETTPDIFSHIMDFEGYRAYLALDNNVSSYALVASYDRDDYLKYTWNTFLGDFELRDNPFTLEELRCLYGSGADPCNDTTFDPNLYTSSNPFVHPLFPDSIFYFEPVGKNPQLGVTTPIRKIYPDAEYPSTLDPNEADPDELTEDGYFKYFEYELTIDNLLPNVLYYVNVTAFDFGAPISGSPALETSVTEGAQSAYVLSGPEIIPTNEWINVYCDYPELNGVPLVLGDVIIAWDPDGVPCGIDTVREDGSFGFMPIYRDDPNSDVDEGAEPGDVIAFKINGEEVFPEPPVVWTANGHSFELCTFTTERCVEIFLHTGWNLISWNVAYSAGIDEIMAQLAKCTCVEVILSFDQGALTYDPDLPEFSTLLEVDYYRAYWFKMNCDATLEICGPPIGTDKNIVIYSGWNLVSYWPNDTLSVEEGFESILDNLLVALGYDYGGLTWLPGDTLFNTLTELKPLFGYWAKSVADDMLAYPGFNPVAAAPKDESGSQIAAAGVVPSRSWMSLYGSGITLDGAELASHSLIEAYTHDGVLCGSGHYTDGLLKFTPVYGYDPMSEVAADYPKDGDPVTLYVNGTRVYSDVEWAGHSSRIRLDQVFSTASGAGLVPDRYALLQNYPNPFNPTTEIAFTLPVASRVNLEIYNVLGQRVTTLTEGVLEAGEHVFEWDGSEASSGVYFYRLQADDFVDTKKMMLLK